MLDSDKGFGHFIHLVNAIQIVNICTLLSLKLAVACPDKLVRSWAFTNVLTNCSVIAYLRLVTVAATAVVKCQNKQ